MKKYILFFALILIAEPAYAYLDPGAGSMFVQALVAVFSVVSSFFSKVKNAIMKVFNKIFHRKENDNE